MSEQAPFTEGDFHLGETRGEHPLESLAAARDAALALARQAHQALRIFSRHLDAELYSTSAFRAAVSELARRDPRTEVRILVQDPTPAIRNHHELLDLVQHLSSHIGARRVAPDWQDEIFAFLLADGHGLLWRPYGDRYDGTVEFAAGPRAREMRKWFDHVWDNSDPDPELRRLRI